jgi:hypothetical protein
MRTAEPAEVLFVVGDEHVVAVDDDLVERCVGRAEQPLLAVARRLVSVRVGGVDEPGCQVLVDPELHRRAALCRAKWATSRQGAAGRPRLGCARAHSRANAYASSGTLGWSSRMTSGVSPDSSR